MWSLARLLPLWGRSPSRGVYGAAACGAELTLLAPARSCRLARGGVALGRHSSVAAARAPGAVRSARRLASSAYGRRRGRFLPEAVATARRSRCHCLRRSAGTPGASSVVPPRSRRRGARSPLFRGSGSRSRRGAYLSIRESYSLNFSVFRVDARCGAVNSHRGAPSRGLEWARFEAASATDPAGRHTVRFPTTLPFSKPTLRMTPIYVISDISRWREYYASEVGCY